VFGLIKALVQLNWAILKGLFLAGLHGILTVSRAVWNAIAAVVRAVWGVIRAVVVREVNGVKKTVSAVWHAIQAVSRAVWNAIMAVIRAVWSRIGGTVTGAANRVKSVVTGAWHAVELVTKAVWNAVVGVIRAAVGRIAQVAGSIKDHVVGALKGAGSWLFNAGKEIIQGLINGITSMINAVTAKIHELTSIIKDHLPGSPVKRGPLMVLNRGHAGQEIVGMLIDGIADMARPLADAMSGVTLNAVPLAASHNSAPVLQTIKVVGGGGGSASRLVKGTLDLSPSGRAFISGVASDVVDDHTTYLGNLGRMSG
jgi:phage-related protein